MRDVQDNELRMSPLIYYRRGSDLPLELHSLDAPPPPTQDVPHLVSGALGLWVSHPSLKKNFQVHFDQGALQRRARQGNELLCKATGASRGTPLLITDATAGLGRESFLLASAGAVVNAIERNVALYWLMRDALRRARSARPELTDRLSLHLADALTLLPTLNSEVIYLDPMFPIRQKSAAVGREAMILQTFESYPSPEEEHTLLECALEFAHYRVVVKRPLKAPPLSGPQPSVALKGKAIRYDIYGKRRLP